MSRPLGWNGRAWVDPLFWDGHRWLRWEEPSAGVPLWVWDFATGAEGWSVVPGGEAPSWGGSTIYFNGADGGGFGFVGPLRHGPAVVGSAGIGCEVRCMVAAEGAAAEAVATVVLRTVDGGEVARSVPVRGDGSWQVLRVAVGGAELSGAAQGREPYSFGGFGVSVLVDAGNWPSGNGGGLRRFAVDWVRVTDAGTGELLPAGREAGWEPRVWNGEGWV